jgi:hypothetical protein
MVLGETVHSFWIAVQILENMVGSDRAARVAGEGQVECRIASGLAKEFPVDANANKNLCIGLNVTWTDTTPLHPERMEMD